MTLRLAALLITVTALAWAGPGLAGQIDAAEDLETFRKLREQVEKKAEAEPQAPETAVLLRRLAAAYDRISTSEGEFDHLAEELLSRAAAIRDEDFDVHECWTLARKYLRERRYEKARSWLARALAWPGVRERADDETSLLSWLRADMGEALEGLGRFEEALGYHESWRPSSFCGNCNASAGARRRNAVARCQYGVGLTREALATLWEGCSAKPYLAGYNHEAFALYAEFSLREDKLDTLRKQFQTLPPEHRKEYAPVLAVAEASAARDSAALIRAVCGHPEEAAFCDASVLASCGRMLDGCGGDVAGELAKAVKEGGFEPVELAGHTHLKGVLPALRSRRWRETDPKIRGWLDWAIARLDAEP